MLSFPGVFGEKDAAVLSLCSLGSALRASDIGRESSQLTHCVRSDRRIYQSPSGSSVVSSVVVCGDEVCLGLRRRSHTATVPGIVIYFSIALHNISRFSSVL